MKQFLVLAVGTVLLLVGGAIFTSTWAASVDANQPESIRYVAGVAVASSVSSGEAVEQDGEVEFSIPEGKYIENGMISDIPPLAPPSAASVSQQEPSVVDGLEVGPGGNTRKIVPLDDGLVRIGFDNVAAPCVFADAMALRNEYAHLGVSFEGPGANDGGAILDQCGNFGVSGHSAPNFLAFGGGFSGGGSAIDPETIVFFGEAAYVEILAGSGSSSGSPVTMQAFDRSNALIASDTITLSNMLQPLSVASQGIARVEISGPSVFVLDDLAFSPESTAKFIDFDDVMAPSGFGLTNALTELYADIGVIFSGPGPGNGGGILNEGSNFGVTGQSSPNFLAFNSNSAFSGGGIPSNPEQVHFTPAVSFVVLFAGVGGGSNSLTIRAFDQAGVVLGSDSIMLGSALQPLSIAADGIARVEISSAQTAFVVDDLGFVRRGQNVVDFDESTESCIFNDTVALRDRYDHRGLTFAGPGVNDGGAVVDECGNFGVMGQSSPNFLAFASGGSLSDGGDPTLPEQIFFQGKASFVSLSAGSSSNAGQILTMTAFNAGGSPLATDSIVLDRALKPLCVSVPNIARVEITGPSVVVLDDLNFDSPLIFIDGFESGDTSAWSITQP